MEKHEEDRKDRPCCCICLDDIKPRFEFTNPSASGTCGCGATFSFDTKE